MYGFHRFGSGLFGGSLCSNLNIGMTVRLAKISGFKRPPSEVYYSVSMPKAHFDNPEQPKKHTEI